MKKLRGLLLVLALICMGLLTVPAFAGTALPQVSSSKYIATHTYSSSGKVYSYTDSTLKKKESSHYIDCAKDECKIYEIKGDAVKVNYPVSGGKTRTAWFKRSDFTYRDLAKDGASIRFTATKKVTTYKWKGNNSAFGYLENKDTCYLLRGDKDSSWLQLIYTVGSHYKMGWVKGADIKSVIWPPAPKPVSVAEGTYNLVSGASSSKVADISDGKTDNGTKVFIWTYGSTKNNQIFKVVHLGSNVYKICSIQDEKKVLDVTGGKGANGTKIQLYQWNNSNAQKWEFYSVGGGYYNIRNKLGYNLDLPSAKTDNGTQLQIWTANTAVAQKWKLRAATPINPVPGDILPTSVSLNITDKKIKVNEEFTLKETINPSNATNKSVSWSSSNSAIAAVNNGKVIARRKGTAIITVKTINGKTAKCAIEVSGKKITVYRQTDPRWKDVRYGYRNAKKTIKAYLGGSGCGVLSLTNAVYYLNGKFIDPKIIANYSLNNGYRINGVGTAFGLYKSFANARGAKYGFAFKGTGSWSTLRDNLIKGNVAICSKPNHIMAIVDYDSSAKKYLLLDSYPISSRGTKANGYVWATESFLKKTVGLRSTFYILKSTI